jgi:ArsR family transcriptional regulator
MIGCENNDIQSFADVLTIISQVNRLQIICLLNKEWELCVCEIIEVLALKQNLVSHHLNVLKNIGLLTTRRDGKKIFYALEKKAYQDLKSKFKYIFTI